MLIRFRPGTYALDAAARTFGDVLASLNISGAVSSVERGSLAEAHRELARYAYDRESIGAKFIVGEGGSWSLRNGALQQSGADFHA